MLVRLARRLRQTVKWLIYRGPVNRALRLVIRPFRRLIPIRTLLRIPLVGKLSVSVPGFPDIWLEIRGLDDVTGLLYWRGHRAYEPEVLNILPTLVRGCDTFLDVGAHVGLYSLLAAAENPRRNVYAFEPVPEIASILRRNREINQLANLHIEVSAVSDRVGEAELAIPYEGVPTSSSLRKGFRDPRRLIRVPTVTLDQFAESRGIARVDLVKIDTETTEPDVLVGGGRLLDRDEPAIICEVLAGYTDSQLNAVLEGKRYIYFLITADGLIRESRIRGDTTYRYRDYLLVPTSRRSLLDALGEYVLSDT